jgi:autoinducer 2-degrading protein
MFVVVVDLAVRPDHLDEFVEGIRVNSRASLRDEPGCLRFDVLRDVEDPRRFVLYEIYTDEDAFRVAHRQAPHYAAWRQVAERCVEPGGHVNTFAVPVFPDELLESLTPTITTEGAVS